MYFSDSMRRIADTCFPQAKVVIDCFHVIQRLIEGLEESPTERETICCGGKQTERIGF